jgi:hypothetical protein
MNTSPLNALDKAIGLFGSQQKLAVALGHKHQSYIGEIRRRLLKGGVVPADICPAIERLTKGKVKRTALNPRVAW